MGFLRNICRIAILIWLFPTISWGAVCDTCEGLLVFSAYFDNADIIQGTPCGCNIEGTTALTLNGDATISTDVPVTGWLQNGATHSLETNNLGYAQITVTPLISAGTIEIDWVIATSSGAHDVVLRMESTEGGGAHNYEMIESYINQCESRYMYNSTTQYSADLASNTCPQDTLFTTTAKWSTNPIDTHTMYYKVNSNSTFEDGADITQWDQLPIRLVIGDRTNVNTMYIRKIRIYNDWLRAGIDTTPPRVTTVTIPISSSSLTVSILTFTATDDVAVTGYLANEVASTPSVGDGGWSSTPQTSYTFGSTGVKTLYGWAKDADGNISSSGSDTVTVYSSTCVQSPAGTFTPASLSPTDIATCVSDMVDGNTISLPAGTSSAWTTALTIDKGIIFKGQGQGITNLNLGNIVAPIIVTAGEPFEMYGISLDTSYTTNNAEDGMVEVRGTCNGWKIHDNTFTHTGTADLPAISVKAYSRKGVIYKNIFSSSAGNAYALVNESTFWGGGTWADTSWSTGITWGTDDFVFFEGNTVTSYRSGIYQNAGSRTVVRYNTFNDAQITAHGMDTTGRTRSTRTQDVHNNSFNDSTGYSNCQVYRGGSGVYYNNVATGYDSNCVLATTYRWTDGDGASADCAGTLTWKAGCCGGTVQNFMCDNNSASCTGPGDTSCTGGAGHCRGPIDDVAGNGIGYPCMDAPGRGTDSGLGTAQALEPIYLWGNSGASYGVTLGSADLALNRDIYKETTAACTDGVTSGLDVAKDVTCANCTDGVGWYSTDTKQLYQCQSNAWVLWYQDYTCPHPLTVLPGSCGPGAGTGYYNLTGNLQGGARMPGGGRIQ